MNVSNSSHPIKRIIPGILFNLSPQHLIFCWFSPILLRQPFVRHLLCISWLPFCRNAFTTFIFPSSLRSLTSSIAYLIPSQRGGRNEIHSKRRERVKDCGRRGVVAWDTNKQCAATGKRSWRLGKMDVKPVNPAALPSTSI